MALVRSEAKPLRWGLISAGKISHDFSLALMTLPATDHRIVAVGARSKEAAEAFAQKFGIEKAYGSYEEVMKDPEVDVVYVGSLNSKHRPISIASLRCQKAVLCEKPVAINSQELDDVLGEAKMAKTFFMEGLWTRCLPLYLDLQKRIANGDLGGVKAVTCTFGVSSLLNVERISKAEVGGGILLDIGSYVLNFADMMFGGKAAEAVHAVGNRNADGNDYNISITLLYPKKGMAQLLLSGGVDLPNEAIVIGTKGKAIVKNPFWAATELEFNGEITKYDLPELKFPSHFANSANLRYEAEHVRQCILDGKLESDLMNHATSRRILKYIDIIQVQLDKEAE